MGRLTVGVDLGGTNLRAAVYSDLVAALEASKPPDGFDRRPPQAPAALATHRERVGPDRHPARVAARIAETVQSLVDEGTNGDEIVPVGLGVAGMPGGPGGVIARAPQLGWTDVPFGDLVRAALGPRFTVQVENDVNAVTFGEFRFGAGVGARDVLAVYVGTGVGGGIVSGGRLVRGAHGCAGEVGHVKVAVGPGARPCGCGGTGCIEAYAGGIHLERRIRSELAAGTTSLVAELAGSAGQANVVHVDEAAARGDAYARDLWEEVAQHLALALANSAVLVDPERLILGGGILERTPDLFRRLVTNIQGIGLSAVVGRMEICRAVLGDDAGLIGAALLAEDEG